MIFEDEDGFEVFEVGDDSDLSWKKATEGWANPQDDSNTLLTKKIRPNDKVTVKYPDGKMEYEVKYKKVKDDVEAGKCTVTRIHTD
jgi:hypothetical protein